MRAFQKYKSNNKYYHSSPGLSEQVWEGISFGDRWQIFAQGFRLLEIKFPSFQLHAFVMMSNHLHVLYSCENTCDQYVIHEFDRLLLGQLRESHLNLSRTLATTVFEDVQSLEPISSYQQLLNTYRYIYRNPVDAGLSLRVEEYPFSTLKEVMGKSVNLMCSMDLLHVIHHPYKILNWLNGAESTLHSYFQR